MRRIRRWSGLLALVALLMVAAGTAAATPATTARPFAGFVVGSSNWYSNPLGCEAGATTITEASGRTTGMGSVDLHMAHCPQSDVTFAGDFVLVAANGDELHGTYAGTGDLTPEAPVGSWFHGTGVMLFDPDTSTGRFAGATGQATIVMAMLFEGYEDPEWPGYWAWFGHLELGS